MPSATSAPLPSFNAYRILSLPSPFSNNATTSSLPPTAVLSPAVIKAAYRRALLTHHPDKQQWQATGNEKKTYTIDDITAAYNTLLDPSARAAHDRALRLRGVTTIAKSGSGTSIAGEGDEEMDEEEEWRLGLEAVDLDDLEFDEAAGRWWRGCRCGANRGFVVDEEALEEAAAEIPGGARGSEVLVGCVGCSLWIRVGFAVAED